MSDPNPREGIVPADPTAPPPAPTGAIAPGDAAGAPPLPKKPYEMHDDEDAALPSLAKPGGDGGGMQSLAQSARGSHLNQARWAMIIVGIITLGANLYFLATNRENVMQILRKQGIQQVPPDVESALAVDRIATIGFIVMGCVFIVLGIAVKAQPVLCTALGLTLYIVGFLIGAALNPASIIQGIIVKIIIVVCLFKALQAARAYESERPDASAAPSDA